MIRCVVKGDKFQAARAAADRGNPFEFDNEGRGATETRGDVPNSHLDLVAEWYSETKFTEMLSGFPVGTLLFYGRRGGEK